MLDIIFATRFFDVGTYYQIGNLNVAVNNQLINGSNNLSSMLKASEKVVEKTLSKINDGFDAIE